MPEEAAYGSARFAEEMVSVFGAEPQPIQFTMKYKRVVERFVKKIERAHKQAEKSTTVFK